MSMLVIAIALLFMHFFSSALGRGRRRTVHSYYERIVPRLRAVNGLDSAFGSLLLVLIPTLLFAVIQWIIWRYGQIWMWFVFSLVTLILTWGSRDLDADVEAYLNASEVDKERARFALTDTYRGSQQDDHTGLIKGIFYQSLVRWFGVIFWFVVVGAAGAVAFRFAHLALSEPRNRDLLSAKMVAGAKRLVSALDLVPAMLVTFALALVGDFDRVMRAWRTYRDNHPHPLASWDYGFLPEVGYQAVQAADPQDAAYPAEHEGNNGQVAYAMSLVWRALITWLVCLALLTLAGWLI